MRFQRISGLIFCYLFSLVCLSCSGMSDPKSGDPSGGDVFETGIVRVADLDATGRAAFANIGADTLSTGKVEVENEEQQGEVKVEVTGAVPMAAYDVQFCSFATRTAGCFIVGSLMTDNGGNMEVKLQFPQHGIFAGVFALTRNNLNQFVSGFAAPMSSSAQEGDDQEQEAEFEESLQSVGAVNGGLGSGFGPMGNDPLMSGRVEAKGKDEGGDNGGEGSVEVTVNGAAANATYMLGFCRFGVVVRGCFSLGSFATDMQGNATAELAFPQAGTFDGVFVVTRDVNGQAQNEFVTAFTE